MNTNDTREDDRRAHRVGAQRVLHARGRRVLDDVERSTWMRGQVVVLIGPVRGRQDHSAAVA